MTFFYPFPARGVVYLTGKDAIAFFERLSSHVATAPHNTLLSQKGRLIDWVHQKITPEGLCLISSHPSGKPLIEALGAYQFAEEVTFVDKTPFYQIGIHVGPFQNPLPDPLSAIPTLSLQNIPAYMVVGPKNAMEAYEKSLSCLLTPAQWETLRINALYPLSPNEINELHNPLELGLEEAISYTKGCYVGQEVISRLKAYGKQGRHLAAITLQPGDTFETNHPKNKILSKDPISQRALVLLVNSLEGVD